MPWLVLVFWLLFLTLILTLILTLTLLYFTLLYFTLLRNAVLVLWHSTLIFFIGLRIGGIFVAFAFDF
jgi:hypothetical protein